MMAPKSPAPSAPNRPTKSASASNKSRKSHAAGQTFLSAKNHSTDVSKPAPQPNKLFPQLPNQGKLTELTPAPACTIRGATGSANANQHRPTHSHIRRPTNARFQQLNGRHRLPPQLPPNL